MRALLLVSILAVTACAGDTPEPEPAPAAEEPATPAAAGLDAAGLAGTWRVTTTAENGDTLPGYTLNAAADPAAWTVQFDGREPMGVHAIIEGDSLVTHFGPYESVLRPGVTVSTEVVSRMQDSLLVGNLTARYANAGADSVMRARTVARRIVQ